MKNLPVVCIVGRPNVGKSSLFNRILGRRAAVVADREGVTRDRHYQEAEWNERRFVLVDTGGFMTDDAVDQLAESVRKQIFQAIEDADVILFLVDVRVGPQTLDAHFARLVLRAGKPVLLVANKAEKPDERTEAWSFLELGLGEPRLVSALTGWGMSSLMEELLGLLPRGEMRCDAEEEPVIRFAVLGRPNAGKSTLLNRMVGEERLVVSDIPGTTRDSIDVEFRWEHQRFIVTDTAGLRKKAKVRDEVEVFANMRTLESIRRSDVCVLLIDATRGMEIQDFRIMEQIRAAGKGLILALNKWDALPDKDHRSFDILVKSLRLRDPMLEWVPVIAISALEGQRVPRLLQEIRAVYLNGRRVLGRDRLVEFFARLVEERPHPARQGKPVHLSRACQILVNPPVIAIECNAPELVDDTYKRFLLKRFFEEFQLKGAPLRLNFTTKLDLRKDEDLGQYGIVTDRVSVGLDSHGGMDLEVMEED